MTRKIIKYAIVILILLFIGYNSVYFRSLSQLQKETNAKAFDPVSYANKYLHNELLPAMEKAPEIDQLLTQINENHQSAFRKYGKSLSIGNARFFATKGSGTITVLNQSEIKIKTPGNQNLTITTEFIFGNALRDAPGIISVNDFKNGTDLNNVSAEVNRLIRSKVIPPFKATAKVGDNIDFAGAFELNQEHGNIADIEIVPVKLIIK